MSTTSRITLSLDRVVARLEQDIRQRGLGAGDQYLTASEAAEMLSISTTTAHRAMQTLARRRMLVRRRNRGTFIGPHFEMKQNTMLRTVYVLVPPVGLDTQIPLEPFIHGIRSHMTQVNVQMTFLPPEGTLPYVRELLRSAPLAGNVAGFVPISCPRKVYRCLADSGLPTVILGTPYADQQDIPSIDADNHMAGRLLTECLIGRGHRRIAWLGAMVGRPGDNAAYDGISEVLTANGLPHNSLIFRSVSPELTAVTAELGKLLAMPDAPTAVIDWTSGLGRVVLAALASLDLPAATKCEVVYANYPTTELDTLSLTGVQAKVSLQGIAARIGDMLEQLGRGDALEEPHVIIPVELCTGSVTGLRGALRGRDGEGLN